MGREFKSTLLREKFVIRDVVESGDIAAPVIALSNRMVLTLDNGNKFEAETYVIRAQNMHTCVRLCGMLAREYYERGAIMGRINEFRWKNVWMDVIKGYERDWNPDIWVAIYNKGRVIFEDGKRHPFLDIIEKCDVASHEDYASSVAFAEKAFQQAGKTVKIEHHSNIALIVSVKDGEAKCGVMLRGARQKTTFTFNVKPKEDKSERGVEPPVLLIASAAFLESVQLAFAVGMFQEKQALHMIATYSDEWRKGVRTEERLKTLNKPILALERDYNVQYRPERPNFKQMAIEAKALSSKILKAQEEAVGPSEWIS